MHLRGARKRDVQGGSTFSVALIFSPRNIASIRARRPDSSARSKKQLERFVGDAIFRVIQVNAGGLRGHALAAPGIIREEVPQVQSRAFSFDALRGRSTPALLLAGHTECSSWSIDIPPLSAE